MNVRSSNQKQYELVERRSDPAASKLVLKNLQSSRSPAKPGVFNLFVQSPRFGKCGTKLSSHSLHVRRATIFLSKIE